MSDETKVEETTNAADNSVSQPIAKPHVVRSQSQPEGTLSKKELLEILFDYKYGTLNGSTVLSKEEYKKHKEWSISSGLFEYQLYRQLFESNDK